MENLLKFLHSLSPLSEESRNNLQPALQEKHFKKGEFLLREGEVCESLFYIDNGYCRSFYLVDGEEKNTAFNFENEIATNVASFGSGQPSAYSIIACEPLDAILFNKKKLMEASKQSPEIETLGRNCIRLFASKQEEFTKLFQLYDAAARLEYIEQQFPFLLQRVPLSQLSSFLGVSRETLSRIRSRRFRA